MYQALYRKWRPKTFDQVVGQEHITETLKNQMVTGRLSHAYLFIGTRGTGKTTCAKILAKALNCQHPVNGNPCCRCPACLGIEDGSILDVVEIDAASNNSVDNIRAMREEALFAPVSVKKRVYIVDEVHMLSGSAFNALLKILEEPPEHLTFILATTELNKVPATILSRCQRHSFKRLSPDAISGHLSYIASQEGMELTPNAAKLIAGLAEGGMRDAISLLDQCSGSRPIDEDAVYACVGLAGSRRISLLMDKTLRRQTEEAIRLFTELWTDGKDPVSLLSELNTLQRDCLMLQLSPDVRTNLLSGIYSQELLKALNRRVTRAELINRINTVSDYIAKARSSQNTRLLAELCVVSLCDPTLTDDVPALRGRIAALEAKLAGIESGAVRLACDEPVPEEEEAADFPDDYEPEEDEAPVRTEFDEDEPTEPEEADPIVVTEYQPEDDLPQNADSAEQWKLIADELRGAGSPLIARIFSSTDRVRGELSASTLDLYALKGVPYTTVSRQEVIMAVREAANRVTGRSLAVKVHEADTLESAPAKSLDTLKQFKETKIKK